MSTDTLNSQLLNSALKLNSDADSVRPLPDRLKFSLGRLEQPMAPETAPNPDGPAAVPVPPARHATRTVPSARPSVMPPRPNGLKPLPALGAADKADQKARSVPIDPADAHVLVVEDNVPNFVLVARLLAYMGIPRCEWKTSGWQVVEFADTLPRIDLILMDIRLPYEDGFQALEKVRCNDRLKDTLVVAVTAEASVEQIKKAKAAGFDGFIAKPLDADRFPEQIRRVLKGDDVWELS